MLIITVLFQELYEYPARVSTRRNYRFWLDNRCTNRRIYRCATVYSFCEHRTFHILKVDIFCKDGFIVMRFDEWEALVIFGCFVEGAGIVWIFLLCGSDSLKMKFVD
jgi:hypothetical protein